MTGRFVQLGAGAIGRSFVGRLFARAGFEVVFADLDRQLVDRLNAAGSYTVVIRENDRADEVQTVGPVRAVDAGNPDAVAGELAGAQVAATAVGARALAHLAPVLARALVLRQDQGRPPLDLLLAENLRGAAGVLRQALLAALPSGFPLDHSLGLVETSVGKMVPLPDPAARARDPLLLVAEAYDTLLADRRGFVNPVPRVSGLTAVEPIGAWVDRKLFLHNLGHAAVAYLGWQADPGVVGVAEALDLPGVEKGVRAALTEASAVLRALWPGVFTAGDLAAHGEDLLRRFRNRALGDSVHRVGRDLVRKLGRSERLLAVCLAAAARGLPYGAVARVVRSALGFAAPDAAGRLLSDDETLLLRVSRDGARRVLAEVAGLAADRADEAAVLAACTGPL